jgi:hypothetical protein
MPAWQVLLLLLAAVAALYLVLGYTNPRTRASQSVVGNSRPKCYPIANDQAVRMWGPENKAYSRKIATASPGAQVLFNLGMLAAHGFNQLEATAWLQVCSVWGCQAVVEPLPLSLKGPQERRQTVKTDPLQHRVIHTHM